MAFIAAPAPLELIMILVIALLVLGPKRLPEAARSLGKGMRELRESLQGSDDDDELDELEDDDDKATVAAAPATAAAPPSVDDVDGDLAARKATADHS